MAAGRLEADGRKSRESESHVEEDTNENDEEMPDFSDPEDFVDDVTDEGIMLLSLFSVVFGRFFFCVQVNNKISLLRTDFLH